MIRAVIDTNVLVSGLLSPAGNEALIVLAINHGLVRPCFSETIVAAYAGGLVRPKFAFPADEIVTLLNMLRRSGQLWHPGDYATTSPDPADAKFLHCTLAADADFIVTGNKRHFPDSPYGSTRVVNAGELLDLLTLEM